MKIITCQCYDHRGMRESVSKRTVVALLRAICAIFAKTNLCILRDVIQPITRSRINAFKRPKLRDRSRRNCNFVAKRNFRLGESAPYNSRGKFKVLDGGKGRRGGGREGR